MQVTSLLLEMDRLSKEKTSLEFQLAELRVRYRNKLNQDIGDSFQSMCGWCGLKGGHGTQLNWEFHSTEMTEILDDVSPATLGREARENVNYFRSEDCIHEEIMRSENSRRSGYSNSIHEDSRRPEDCLHEESLRSGDFIYQEFGVFVDSSLEHSRRSGNFILESSRRSDDSSTIHEDSSDSINEKGIKCLDMEFIDEKIRRSANPINDNSCRINCVDMYQQMENSKSGQERNWGWRLALENNECALLEEI